MKRKQLRQRIHDKYNGKCAYCGCDIEIKDMQIDHIFPKRRVVYTDFEISKLDEEDNLNPACRECNYYKSDFLIEEFRKQMHTLHERVMKPFIARLSVKYEIFEYKEWDGKFYFEKIEDEKNNQEVI